MWGGILICCSIGQPHIKYRSERFPCHDFVGVPMIKSVREECS